jgi:hypothetical protein
MAVQQPTSEKFTLNHAPVTEQDAVIHDSYLTAGQTTKSWRIGTEMSTAK